MSRVLSFAYGVIAYVIFLATFLYAIGWVGNFAAPTRLDAPGSASLGVALAVNLGLLGLFAIQHSVMARPTFKRWWTRIIPPHIERSTYVLFSSLALIVMFVLWQPMGGVVWQVTDPIGRMVLYGVYAFGWALVLVSTFLINHFDLFGLRQVWVHLRGQDYTPPRFGTPVLYRLVRHPLYVGWFFAFWATPTMTAAHLLFAAMTAGYILIAIQLEERNLIDEHGERYLDYRKSVPMLVPFTKSRAEARPADAVA